MLSLLLKDARGMTQSLGDLLGQVVDIAPIIEAQ
jgi:hypothetical protein